jgi:hypothetical protein
MSMSTSPSTADDLPEQDWCEECQSGQDIADESDETAGYEEQERHYHVIYLQCGHEISWPITRRSTY